MNFQSKEGQQSLLEVEERLVPFSAVEEGFQKINDQFARNQQRLEGKVERLVNSLEQIVPKFEQFNVSEKSPDMVVSPYSLANKSDLASISSPLPAESSYPLTTAELAQLVGMHPSRLGTLLPKVGITGDAKFHYAFKTGKKVTPSGID